MPKTSELTRNRDVPRNIYIDFIRIIASFFVVYLHTGNYGVWNYMLHPVISIPFWVELCISVFARTAVPLFLMISGALLLKKLF